MVIDIRRPYRRYANGTRKRYTQTFTVNYLPTRREKPVARLMILIIITCMNLNRVQ